MHGRHDQDAINSLVLTVQEQPKPSCNGEIEIYDTWKKSDYRVLRRHSVGTLVGFLNGKSGPRPTGVQEMPPGSLFRIILNKIHAIISRIKGCLTV